MTSAVVPVAVGVRLRPRRPDPVSMPLTGPLVDRFGRVHDDLRLSVTDRCGLRCVYCMPEGGIEFQGPEAGLAIGEIAKVAGIARSLGVRSLRLTGGEPLLRRGVVELVGALSELGFEDLSMTTNGMALERFAPRLAAAGLQRVNVSCDSLRPERFSAIRRRGDLERVLRAMDAAEEAGLRPVKVNVVLMAGVNDDEVLDFAAFARSTGRTVRFIEYMPLDADRKWRDDLVVPGSEVLERIGRVYPLMAVPSDRGNAAASVGEAFEVPLAVRTGDAAPAERFAFVDAQGSGDRPGEIGVIRSVTQPFCGTCNRLRVTADGAVRNCLFSDEEISLLPALRRGDDEGIAAAFRRAVWGKRAGHGTDEGGFAVSRRSMSMIGG